MSLFLLQLSVTFGAVALFTFVPGTDEIFRSSDSNVWQVTSIVVIILDAICIGVIAFQPSLVKRTPNNYIALAVVTVCTALPLAVFASHLE